MERIYTGAGRMDFLLINALYIFLHLLIAVYDFSFYRIPNLFLGILIILFGIYAPIYMEGGEIINSILVFFAVLLAGFGLCALKFFGAGDAKYLAVVSLWVGLQGFVSLILVVAIVGGVLGFLYLLFRDHIARLSDWLWAKIQELEKHNPIYEFVWIGSGRGAEKGKRAKISSRKIPYGLAIAMGAIFMTIFIGL